MGTTDRVACRRRNRGSSSRPMALLVGHNAAIAPSNFGSWPLMLVLQRRRQQQRQQQRPNGMNVRAATTLILTRDVFRAQIRLVGWVAACVACQHVGFAELTFIPNVRNLHRRPNPAAR